MSFIKHGDGKIVTVLEDTAALTDEQKKSIKDKNDQNDQTIKQSETTDTSVEQKKSGN